MDTYIPVAGTWDWDPWAQVRGETRPRAWWQAGSAFDRLMELHGVERRGLPDDIPFWSTAISGISTMAASMHLAWWRGAHVLASFVRDLPIVDRNVVALSHGGQVALLCAGWLEPVHRIITIGTPVRKDLTETYQRAAAVAQHRHLYSTGWENKMQVLGGLFDRQVGWSWTMPYAENRCREGIGHSDLLRNPQAHESIIVADILGW